MRLVRWDPFSADDVFNRMMPALFGRLPRMALSADEGAKYEWAPSADISETDKEYLIRAELPAVKKEDVKVTVEEGTITIEGERKQQKEDTTERYHRKETLYGTFMRSFSIPENADVEGIRCDSKDGVLTVHIPKTKASPQQPKEIKVQ